MNKKAIIVSIISFLVVVGVVGAVTMNIDELRELLSVNQEVADELGYEGEMLGGLSPTSTDFIGRAEVPIYVATTTATTTSNVIWISPELSQIDLNIYMQASSTGSKVSWQYEFSDDRTNWYGEDTKSVSGSTVTHQAATTTHQWTPGITIPATKNVGITNFGSRWFRLKAFRSLDGATASTNFALWIRGIRNYD